MAQVIITDEQQNAESMRTWARTAVLGALAGLLFWLIALLLGHYVIEPLTCGQNMNAAVCSNATPLAGNIAAVLVAVAGIVAMVRLRAARPIVIAAASAALLWDLAFWTQGLFWLEAIGWSVLVYALSYALFAWITRYASVWVTIVLSLLLVVIIRIALVL